MHEITFSLGKWTAEPDTTFIAITGHMIDRPSRTRPRFPPGHVEDVRRVLTQTLDEIKNREKVRLLTSATKGVDLLAVEYAIERGILADVFLPQDEGSFLANAINYGDDGSAWADLYQRAKHSPGVTIHLPVHASDPLRPFQFSEKATPLRYQDLNEFLCHLLRPWSDLLVAYWDGRAGDKAAGTEHMIQVAQRKGVTCLVLNRYLENAAPD